MASTAMKDAQQTQEGNRPSPLSFRLSHTQCSPPQAKPHTTALMLDASWQAQ